MTGMFGIEEVPATTPGAVICGDCGKAWVEDITPASRCPWEAEHVDPLDAIDLIGTVVTVENPKLNASWTGVAVAIAHDPSVLVEDQVTGLRYLLPLAWVKR